MLLSSTLPIVLPDVVFNDVLHNDIAVLRSAVKLPRSCCEKDDRLTRGVANNIEDLVNPEGSPNVAGALFGTEPYVKFPVCSFCDAMGGRLRFPGGIVGQRLWVQETWQTLEVCYDYEGGYWDSWKECQHKLVKDCVQEFGLLRPRHIAVYRADGSWEDCADAQERGFRWFGAASMPRKLSRMDVEITDIKIEKVPSLSWEVTIRRL